MAEDAFERALSSIGSHLNDAYQRVAIEKAIEVEYCFYP
jgi:hypothetical protein